MVIGVCRLTLHIPENHSLKGKRQVIRSLIERVRQRFAVSVAEVDDLDQWQSAVLGIAYVSTETAHANRVLDAVVRFIESARVEAHVTDYAFEFLHL
jgi:uncharacterized protein YlxP (DUF503 family)